MLLDTPPSRNKTALPRASTRGITDGTGFGVLEHLGDRFPNATGFGLGDLAGGPRGRDSTESGLESEDSIHLRSFLEHFLRTAARKSRSEDE